MELTRIVAPAEPVISLEDARAQCRVDAWGSPPSHPEDDLIQAYVQAATDELDGPDAWLGRALVTQTWRLTMPSFPDGGIILPLTSPKPATSPPPSVVQKIAYLDSDGVEQELAASAYRVITEADPMRIEAAFDTRWPATMQARDAVRITYTAGYGDPADVPEIIRDYIRLRVGQLYDHRQAIVVGTVVNPQPYIRDSLESLRMRGKFRWGSK